LYIAIHFALLCELYDELINSSTYNNLNKSFQNYIFNEITFNNSWFREGGREGGRGGQIK
jgi:hypothetical protein